MALGQVIVNNENLHQGEPTEVERIFLFIGKAPLNQKIITPINTQSDFDKLFGTDESSLKNQLTAAFLNANSDWNAVAYALDDTSTWQDALNAVMKANYKLEGIIICEPIATGKELEDMHAAAIAVINTYQRRHFIGACITGIDSSTQTWQAYIAEKRAITDGISAERVCCVPLLHGNDLGVLAGRLANSAVSIADSPMRVKTGALVGLGETPTDMNGEPLELDTLMSLDAARFSVAQTYPDYDGTYWGDANMIAVETSDYKVVEHLRVVDKACRRIRLKAITYIGDRAVNNRPDSEAATITDLMKPLYQMAQSTVINNVQFPGEIAPPEEGDIVLQWANREHLKIFIMVQPINCPKKITASIMLDLSTL